MQRRARDILKKKCSWRWPRPSSAARRYIHETYDAQADLANESVYTQGVQYINGDADGEYPGMYWSIDYQPKTVEAAEYWVYIDPTGKVLGAIESGNITEKVIIKHIWWKYEAIYGNDFGKWTPE